MFYIMNQVSCSLLYYFQINNAVIGIRQHYLYHIINLYYTRYSYNYHHTFKYIYILSIEITKMIINCPKTYNSKTFYPRDLWTSNIIAFIIIISLALDKDFPLANIPVMFTKVIFVL